MDHLTDYISHLHDSLQDCLITNRFEAEIDRTQAEEELVGLISEVKESHNKVFLVGNGGSAAIVSHMQNDLCKVAKARAMVLTEVPLLTALTNDDGYETAYQQQIELWGEPGDLLIAVSSSGQSENILRACGAAQQRGIAIVTLSGFEPANTLRQLGDLNFYIPSFSYGMVELAHSVIGHFLTDRIGGMLPKREQEEAWAKR